MQKSVIALGLAVLLLAEESPTASAAFTVPPAKSVIGNSDLKVVRWRRCWLPRRMRVAQVRPAHHIQYSSDQPTRDLQWLWYDP